jgi:hypothetical protein
MKSSARAISGDVAVAAGDSAEAEADGADTWEDGGCGGFFSVGGGDGVGDAAEVSACGKGGLTHSAAHARPTTPALAISAAKTHTRPGKPTVIRLPVLRLFLRSAAN